MIKLSKQEEVICKYSIEYLFHEFKKNSTEHLIF